MKKKILFALKNLNIGGVEKALLSQLSEISREEYDIDVLLLEKNGGFLDQLPNDVNLITYDYYSEISDEVNLPPVSVIINYFIKLKIKRALLLLYGYICYKLTKDYSKYYKAIFMDAPMLEKEYDVAISYTSIIEYLTWIVNEKVNSKKRIGWIHFDIRKIYFNHDFLLKLHKNMEKIYVVSNEGLQAFVSEFPELKEKCELKYNVIDKTQILAKSTEKAESIKQDGVITILTLGRLSSEKGQDIIPDIALKLKQTGEIFKWYIIGDGALRTIIEEKIAELNLEDCVILLGTKSNPYPYLKQADVYVQTSIHEGYCITLAEAKLFGMPIVSTDFAGAHEQLDEIENGFVVKRNVKEICDSILELMYEKDCHCNKLYDSGWGRNCAYLDA